MSEFNNRIAAQRDILLLINSASWKEELYGLSSGAIERWLSENKIERQSTLVVLLEKAASKLVFLSNKSQEQVTDEYKDLSREVQSLTEEIKYEITRLKSITKL